MAIVSLGESRAAWPSTGGTKPVGLGGGDTQKPYISLHTVSLTRDANGNSSSYTGVFHVIGDNDFQVNTLCGLIIVFTFILPEYGYLRNSVLQRLFIKGFLQGYTYYSQHRL